MPKHSVHASRGPLHEIKESSGVEIGLLIEEIELSAKGLLAGREVSERFGLEAWSKSLVVQLELGREDVDSIPALGQGQACASIEHQHRGLVGTEDDGKVEAVVSDKVRACNESKRFEEYTGCGVRVFGLDRAARGTLVGIGALDIEADSIRGFRLNLNPCYEE